MRNTKRKNIRKLRHYKNTKKHKKLYNRSKRNKNLKTRTKSKRRNLGRKIGGNP